MTKSIESIAGALMAAVLTTACSTQTQEKPMSKEFSLDGFQAASLPHPGTITFIESWNDLPKRKSADEYPDSFKFLCLDENENEATRDKAKWCIPILEFDIFSTGEDGKSVPFEKASSISITAYGPNHRFVRSLSTAPPPPLPPESAPKPMPESAVPPAQMNSAAQAASLSTDWHKAGVATRDQTQLTFWEKLKKAIRGV